MRGGARVLDLVALVELSDDESREYDEEEGHDHRYEPAVFVVRDEAGAEDRAGADHDDETDRDEVEVAYVQPVLGELEEGEGDDHDVCPGDEEADGTVAEYEPEEGVGDDRERDDDADLGGEPVDETDSRTRLRDEMRGVYREDHPDEVVDAVQRWYQKQEVVGRNALLR